MSALSLGWAVVKMGIAVGGRNLRTCMFSSRCTRHHSTLESSSLVDVERFSRRCRQQCVETAHVRTDGPRRGDCRGTAPTPDFGRRTSQAPYTVDGHGRANACRVTATAARRKGHHSAGSTTPRSGIPAADARGSKERAALHPSVMSQSLTGQRAAGSATGHASWPNRRRWRRNDASETPREKCRRDSA